MSGCERVLDVLEGLAEGGAADEEVSAHVRGCSRCAAALARARQIHRALQALPGPTPPPDFTATVIKRTRSLRWRSEERFDSWFNAVIVACLALVALGVWGLFDVTGLAAVTAGTADFIGRSVPELYAQVKPELPLYLTATGLVAGSLGVWWWLERAGRSQRAT